MNSDGVTAYTNPLSQTVSYSFDDADRKTGISYPTGVGTSFAYDAAGRQPSQPGEPASAS